MSALLSTTPDTRQLRDLAGIGKSIEANLHSLGVNSVPTLASRDGEDLYHQLCAQTRTRQDPCVLDTFRCVVAQARNPSLPAIATQLVVVVASTEIRQTGRSDSLVWFDKVAFNYLDCGEQAWHGRLVCLQELKI